MPRGRKRDPPAGNELPLTKEPKLETVDEEEIFVDIVETDDGPDLQADYQLEEATDAAGSSAVGQIPDNVVKNPRVSKPRRRLPPPRLVNPNPTPPTPKPRKQQAARATIRTRAQTVHESVLEEMKVPKAEEGLEGGEQAETEEHKCAFCGLVLYSSIELLEHQRGFHKEQVKEEDFPTGTLLCSYPHCFTSFPDVRHLIAHLVAFHSQQQYRIQKKTWDDIDKFWNWKNEAENTARAKFMGRDEPESSSVSADAFEFSNYCEFCDDWREQHEKGPSMPEQVPRKIIGCPAYFTATIDNKKRKASVVGCFAHLGHHKKLSINAQNDAKNRTHNGPSPAGNFANIKCNYCDMMFRSRSAATRHHRIVHHTVQDSEGNKRQIASEPKMPSLECADPECSVLCDSMVTLVQHVAEAHKVDVQVNDYTFPNMEKFEAWKTEMEQNTCSKFCKVSGRVLPNEITKYFLCHLSGHTNRTKKKEYTPSDRQRNRPTKKMGRYCTAFMSFKQSKSDGSITVRGCLRHFGHPLDVRRLPLPDQVRKEVADLLLKGCVEEEVVVQVRSQYSENERGYWLQRYEVRNIALKLQREGLMIASKTFLASEEDGRLWDEMGFPEDSPYLPQFVQTSSKLVPMHPDRRYVSRSTMQKLEVLQFVETGEYGEEEGEELVDMEEDGEVYYEQEIEETDIQTDDGTRVIPLQPHVVAQHLISEDMPGPSHGGRKRMPLLKEPMRTGNPVFDDVMARMKTRFNKISQQLKVTQDVRLAHGMLKELKELQQRMGVVSPEDESQLIEAHWNDEYFEDEEEYPMEQEDVVHEEEVAEEGYEYIDEANVVVEEV